MARRPESEEKPTAGAVVSEPVNPAKAAEQDAARAALLGGQPNVACANTTDQAARPEKAKLPAASVDYPVVECPACLSRDTHVVSHPTGWRKKLKPNGTFRYRVCRSCKKEFKEPLDATAQPAA